MIPWSSRSPEERALLNPSFCSVMLWHAAIGYVKESVAAMPFGLAFLILPLALHRETREALPASVVTSLPVWLDESALIRVRVAERARLLAPYTKEALLFGGCRGFLSMSVESVSAAPVWRRRISAVMKTSSDEVRACAKKADFTGRWFARAGSPATVMALLGVRP